MVRKKTEFVQRLLVIILRINAVTYLNELNELIYIYKSKKSN